MVLSPFGVFDFEPVSKRMRVKSLNPDVTVEQVQKQTGFELLVDGTPPVTSMPTAEELGVLREKVDSTGVLRERRRA
jgi:glutaconate CoA-transferase subunit B